MSLDFAIEPEIQRGFNPAGSAVRHPRLGSGASSVRIRAHVRCRALVGRRSLPDGVSNRTRAFSSRLDGGLELRELYGGFSANDFARISERLFQDGIARRASDPIVCNGSRDLDADALVVGSLENADELWSGNVSSGTRPGQGMDDVLRVQQLAGSEQRRSHGSLPRQPVDPFRFRPAHPAWAPALSAPHAALLAWR